MEIKNSDGDLRKDQQIQLNREIKLMNLTKHGYIKDPVSFHDIISPSQSALLYSFYPLNKDEAMEVIL